jgi:hypothetical protein
VAANHLKNATTNQKTVSLVLELFKKRDEDDGYKGGGRATAMSGMAMAMAMAMTWAMAMAMRLAGDEEGKDKGGKGNGDGNEGGKGRRGGGRQGNGMVTRMASKWTATAMKRAMATARRVAGKQRQR